MSSRLLAVCLHDVEHATLERCRHIRRWLADRGVGRMTLLAIPASGGAPLVAQDRCAAWLRERATAGDAIAQHGVEHRRSRSAGALRDWLADRQGGAAAEFVGLDAAHTVQAVRQGQALLHAAGLDPRGFVAPAYAYTAALRRELHQGFEWYGGLFAVHCRRPLRVPAHGLGTSTRFKRRSSPPALCATTRLARTVLRLDVHPADFDFPTHVAALSSVLQANQDRHAMTYDELTA